MSTTPERDPHARAISVLYGKHAEYKRKGDAAERHRQQAILLLEQEGLSYSQRRALEDRLRTYTAEAEKYTTWARLLKGSIAVLEQNGAAE